MLRYSERYDYKNSEFDAIKVTVANFLTPDGAAVISGEEDYVNRVLAQPINFDKYIALKPIVKHVGVTKYFKGVIDYFKVPAGEIPAGFRIEYTLEGNDVLRVDLVRDISYDKNGQKRPTNVLFSADSANPYEVAAIKNVVANLTCNPSIVYDLFINNPKANVGNVFKTREEAMAEIGRVLGPGADISVELNDPFADRSQLLEEAAQFKEMLSEYRVVIKVPHTGAVNGANINELVTGNRKFGREYNDGTTADYLHGHNLALFLQENGYRVNFTLMFDPHQVALALNARPYFINTFLKFRWWETKKFRDLLACYEVTNDNDYLKQLRDYMVTKDYIQIADADLDLSEVKARAEYFVNYRNINNHEGADGLDQARHALRVLRQCNMPDSRLIICSMQQEMYPNIDKMLAEEEFRDQCHRVVLTTDPHYLASNVCSPGMIHYHRTFTNAVNSGK